jgi:hypothetical protein
MGGKNMDAKELALCLLNGKKTIETNWGKKTAKGLEAMISGMIPEGKVIVSRELLEKLLLYNDEFGDYVSYDNRPLLENEDDLEGLSYNNAIDRQAGQDNDSGHIYPVIVQLENEIKAQS